MNDVDSFVERLTAGCNCHVCRHVLRKHVEALLFVSEETARERKALRRGEPTPIQGVDAGLVMLKLAVDEALGIDSALRTYNLQDYQPRLRALVG